MLQLQGIDSGTPKGRAHAYPHAQKNGVQLLRKGVQRLHALPRTLNAICTPSIGVQACRACTPVWRGVQSLHTLWTGVQALHACWLT
ncbi:hypothetical protein PCANC_26064 [Puccinia coronata f. sp. avenae]|uniref:Uncharacterized protein n=1 Tax=Puccinia coronata f. sp. avenae TaxID=200324 RepID=A0A2N5TVH2_9BASI|nr:hypothetical protein PCANC_26064 [Puccinia coronata f. sp. avenae]